MLPYRSSCIQQVKSCSHIRTLCLAIITLCTAAVGCERPDPCDSVGLLKDNKLDASSLQCSCEDKACNSSANYGHPCGSSSCVIEVQAYCCFPDH